MIAPITTIDQFILPIENVSTSNSSVHPPYAHDLPIFSEFTGRYIGKLVSVSLELHGVSSESRLTKA
jgi:hypothetical protein